MAANGGDAIAPADARPESSPALGERNDVCRFVEECRRAAVGASGGRRARQRRLARASLVDIGIAAAYTYVNKVSAHPVATPIMAGSNLYTGTLDLLVLKALSWGPRHGYAIGRWIRETTEDVLVVQEGVLYPALHRLERRRLLSEEWRRSETGRDAKYYALTPAGRKHLRDETSRWVQHSRAVNRALAVST